MVYCILHTVYGDPNKHSGSVSIAPRVPPTRGVRPFFRYTLYQHLSSFVNNHTRCSISAGYLPPLVCCVFSILSGLYCSCARFRSSSTSARYCCVVFKSLCPISRRRCSKSIPLRRLHVANVRRNWCAPTFTPARLPTLRTVTFNPSNVRHPCAPHQRGCSAVGL